VIRNSLPDIFRFALRLPPTRAHPPPTQPRATTCRLALPPPCHARRAIVWGGGGFPTCSGTGRLGGRGGPLWVPGLSTRRSMHGCLNNCQGESGGGSLLVLMFALMERLRTVPMP
jgi:hypothetical protein